MDSLKPENTQVLTDWQTFLKKAYGFSDSENKFLNPLQNGTTGTQNATNHYLNKIDSLLANRQIAENLLISSGVTSKSQGMESLLNYQKSVLEAEMSNLLSASTGVDSNGNLMWNSKAELEKFNSLIKAMGLLQDQIKENTSALELQKAKDERSDAFRKGDIIGGGRGLVAEGQLQQESGNYWAGTGKELAGALLSETVPRLLQSIESKIDKSTVGGKALSSALGGLESILNGTNPIVATIVAVANFLMDWLLDDDEDTEKEQAEILKAIKGQLETLSNTVSDQLNYLNEVQLKMQQAFINNQISAGVRSVNDMIISPHGNFSTAPDDYIMAMKDPTALMGKSNVKLNVVINNSASSEIATSVEERTGSDGLSELVVNISKKVANDVAQGTNGWDSAFAIREQRIRGRSL